MGTYLPLLPAAIVAPLPRWAQCIALVTAQQAGRVGSGEGRAWLSYRRLSAVLGLGHRRQIEQRVEAYWAAIGAVTQAMTEATA